MFVDVLQTPFFSTRSTTSARTVCEACDKGVPWRLSPKDAEGCGMVAWPDQREARLLGAVGRGLMVVQIRRHWRLPSDKGAGSLDLRPAGVEGKGYVTTWKRRWRIVVALCNRNSEQGVNTGGSFR